jgi:hypothetical protein
MLYLLCHLEYYAVLTPLNLIETFVLHTQGCQVVDLSAIFADLGLMEKLLAEWKNLIQPLPKVAESGLIESILAE